MKKYIVEQRDPASFKKEIKRFWLDYLPGTPTERYEWLKKGNPAGKTIWYVAIERKNSEIAGIISVMPKDFYIDGKHMKAGILGDFMIKKKYRVFGPAVVIIKKVLEDMEKNGFEIFYTVPNTDSQKVLERAGMKISRTVECIGLPISYKYYLSKYMSETYVGIVSYICEQFMRLYCREILIRANGAFEKVNNDEKRFDMLDEKRRNKERVTSDISAAYIKWRYINNPGNNYCVYTYQEKKNKDIDGYVVFTGKNRKIEIYDIYAFKRSSILKIMKKVISYARSNNYQAIYLHTSVNSTICRRIRRLLPFNFRNSYQIFTKSKNGDNFVKKWEFTAGDRNL